MTFYCEETMYTYIYTYIYRDIRTRILVHVSDGQFNPQFSPCQIPAHISITAYPLNSMQHRDAILFGRADMPKVYLTGLQEVKLQDDCEILVSMLFLPIFL